MLECAFYIRYRHARLVKEHFESLYNDELVKWTQPETQVCMCALGRYAVSACCCELCVPLDAHPYVREFA